MHKAKMTEGMMKTARLILKHFISYRRQMIHNHGDVRGILWIDDEANETIVIMAYFDKRKIIQDFLQNLKEEDNYEKGLKGAGLLPPDKTTKI